MSERRHTAADIIFLPTYELPEDTPSDLDALVIQMFEPEPNPARLDPVKEDLLADVLTMPTRQVTDVTPVDIDSRIIPLRLPDHLHHNSGLADLETEHSSLTLESTKQLNDLELDCLTTVCNRYAELSDDMVDAAIDHAWHYAVNALMNDVALDEVLFKVEEFLILASSDLSTTL